MRAENKALKIRNKQQEDELQKFHLGTPRSQTVEESLLIEDTPVSGDFHFLDNLTDAHHPTRQRHRVCQFLVSANLKLTRPSQMLLTLTSMAPLPIMNLMLNLHLLPLPPSAVISLRHLFHNSPHPEFVGRDSTQDGNFLSRDRFRCASQ